MNKIFFYMKQRIFGIFPDYTEFEQDGTMKANGKASCFRDEYVGGERQTPLGVSAPDAETYTIGGVVTRKYAFNGTSTEETLSNSFEIPHDYMYGTPIEVHVHCRASTNDAGNVQWFFDRSYDKLNVAPSPQTALNGIVGFSANEQYFHKIVTLGVLPDHGYGIGDLINFRLRRTPSGSLDTYGQDVILEKVALHVQIDTLGSRERYTK